MTMYNDYDQTIRPLEPGEFEAARDILDLPFHQEMFRRISYRESVMKRPGGREAIAEYDRRYPDRILL